MVRAEGEVAPRAGRWAVLGQRRDRLVEALAGAAEQVDAVADLDQAAALSSTSSPGRVDVVVLRSRPGTGRGLSATA